MATLNPDDLSAATDEQLTELITQMGVAFDQAYESDEPDSLAAMQKVADDISKVRAEQDARSQDSAVEEAGEPVAAAADMKAAKDALKKKLQEPAEGSPEEEAAETPAEETLEVEAGTDDPADEANDPEDVADGGADEKAEGEEVPAKKKKAPVAAACGGCKKKKSVCASCGNETEAPVVADAVAVEEKVEAEAEVAEEVAPEAEVEATPKAVADEAKAEETSQPKAEASETGEVKAETAEADATAETPVAEATSEEGEAEMAEVPAERRPTQVEELAPEQVKVPVVATAGAPGMAPGQEFADYDALVASMASKIDRTLRGGSGEGYEQMSVAQVSVNYPENRMLDTSNEAANSAKIQSAVGETAIVASGGYCAPAEIRYDVFTIGDTMRPLRDALPSFGASRGGITFTTPPKFTDMTGALGVWTAANDANPTAPATKPCLKLPCGAQQTVYLDALTSCVQVGNLQARAWPEYVKAQTGLLMVAHARQAEQYLFDKMVAASVAVTGAFQLSVTRDIYDMLAKAAARYRGGNRVARGITLRAVMPHWLKDAMKSDLAMSLPGDHLRWSDADIDGIFSDLNIKPIWVMDDVTAMSGVQAAGALVNWPATAKIMLFADGTFLHLDGGTLDLGVVRDGALVATNDYKIFSESFEGIAKVGGESFILTADVKVTGQCASTTDTTP